MADEDALEDAATLVTGASSGIGAATAHRFAAAGGDVALASRSEDALASLADEIEAATDATALVLPTDVTDESAVEAAVDETVAAFGGLNVVVSNAGLGRDAPVEEMTTEQYRTMMDVNCDGMFFVSRAAIPHLRATGGNLIFVASFAGEYPRPGSPVYAATKWWTRGLAHSLAGSVGEDGVGVTVVNPTEVRTQFGDAEGDAQAERFAPGEVTEPDEVADAIAFAARQEPPNVVHELDLYRRDKLSHF
ncbi:MAG: SDR family oxidoreductase [Halobacteriaceae archaeon]